MLRITMNKSAAGAKKYYTEEYYREGADKTHDYYTDKELSIGMWGGKAADKLALSDNISKADFAALCDNLRPDNGEALTERTTDNRRIGYDFTFNCSKSVGLAYSFASEADKQEIISAFHQSVTEAMTEVEKGMQARVRKKGQNENRKTGNIVYGEFTHFTSRPVDGTTDPHLHSHCFVFNATYDETDKKWKAGQFGQIKHDAPYYEAYFQSVFAGKLQQAGYKIQRTKDGFELQGVSKDIMQRYSRRTAEIEAHAIEHNITSAEQKAAIGSLTREAKRAELTPEQQQAEWRNRISDVEYKQLTSLKTKPTNNGDVVLQSKQALNYAIDHHLERKSVATDKEILATAIKASVGNTTPEHIKAELLTEPETIRLTKGLETYITTHTALNEEKQLIRNAVSFKGFYRPINEVYVIKKASLNEQQQLVVKSVLGTTNGLSIITGKAGTGKTTLMKEVQQGIREAGKEIYAFAPSAEASRNVQRSEGFENANTVASLIQAKDHSHLKQQVIWIDEAGMLSNKDLNRILTIAKTQNARLILSGDTRQHNSVERGDALRTVEQYAGYRTITISHIQRQLNKDYKEAVKYIADGNMEKGFNRLDKMGVIHEIDDHQERIKAIAYDYINSSIKKNVIVVSPTHAEGELVTSAIRKGLKDSGQIGVKEKTFTGLRNLQLTNAQKSNPENYQAGQVLCFNQHVKGIKKGTRLTVVDTETSQADKRIYAKVKDGNIIAVPLTHPERLQVHEEAPFNLSKGDKIRITDNGKTLDGKHIYNGATYNITGFDKEGNVKLSNGSVLGKDYGHFTQGYVVTSHASQGKTADKVILSQSAMSFRASGAEQFYVSVSRGRKDISIYTDDKESLLQAVTRSSQRISATELITNKHDAIIRQTMQRIRSLPIHVLNQRQNELRGTYKANYPGKGR